MQQPYLDVLKEAKFTTMPGVGNYEEIEFQGMKLYTNNKLKENVKNVSKKYLTKIASTIVTRLLDSGEIIPVFKSKNIINYLKNKKKENKLGTTYEGRIYLFLDEFYSLVKLSTINEKFLASILLHELIHAAEQKNKSLFLRINLNYFIQFYKYFFSYYLKVDDKKINDKIFIDLIKRINDSQKKGFINFNIYIPVFKYLEEFTKLSDEEYEERYNTLINYLDDAFEKYQKVVPGDIWRAGEYAYNKFAGGKNETLGQEFWSPSEIISITSEINPKHPSIDNTLKILI